MKRKKTLTQNAATIQQQKDFLATIAFGSLTLAELERFGHYYEITGPAHLMQLLPVIRPIWLQRKNWMNMQNKWKHWNWKFFP